MLIVGLGNPGSEYKATRHNAGFLAIDFIADYLSCSWQHSSKFSGEIATTIYEGKKIILFKPGNYMNLSGLPVSQVKNYYKVDNSDIFVMHDELDLESGDLRYKFAGGSAGHNGIKSLDTAIGNNYHRIRIGIGKPFDKDQVSDFVLTNFINSEKKIIDNTLATIRDNFKYILAGNIEAFKAEIVKSPIRNEK